MSDIIDTSFLMPYPTSDVYGIGIASSPVPATPPAPPPTQPEAQGGAPFNEIEGLGRYVDVKV